MLDGKSILAIIPARGGSKGLPGKNIRLLMGKPLIAWTIERAISSICIDRVVVSTDDSNIASVAKECGADVPYIRPAELARDESPTFDSIVHALDFLGERRETYDIVILLEPTSPLRGKDDIDRALQLLVENWDNADSLVSLGEIHMESPYIAKNINTLGYVSPVIDSVSAHQRQQLPAAYFPYGVIYASKIDCLLETGTFYQDRTIPYFIQRWQTYEIDDEFDFICIEAIAGNMGVFE